MSVGHRPGRFAIPRQRRSTVPRGRLLADLHGAIGNGLILVSAPAGYGKTTVLSAFAAEVDFDVRWLTLDSSCAAPEVLAQHLASAVGTAEGIAPATSEKVDDLRAYLDYTLSRAYQDSIEPILLIIDNVHEVVGSAESEELLGWVLEAVPEGTEIILSGRELPPLTLVDQLVATGDCLLLESRDLAFAEDEIRGLLAANGDLTPERVLTATGGWPAGVMAMLTGAGAPAGHLSRAGHAWDRYLESQVWRTVPADIQENLLTLTVAHTAEPGLGRALLGKARWEATVAWLERNDFLCEPLPGGAYRLNPLFHQFVASRASKRGSRGSEVDRAAAWFEQRNQTADAIELALQADAPSTVADLVRRNMRELLHGGQFVVLRRAFAGLPNETLDTDPLLRAMRSRVLAHTGRPGEALDEVSTVLAEGPLAAIVQVHAYLGQIRALRVLGRHGELEEAFADLHRVPLDLDLALRAEVSYHEAQWTLPANSDFARAEALLRDSLNLCRQAGLSTIELLASSTLGQLLAMRGDAPEAVNELTRAAAGWRRRGRTSNLGWVLNNLGMVYLALGDFESATATLEEALGEARACENQRNLAYATASLGDALLAAGRFDDARPNYEEAIRICAEEVADETLASLSITGLAACHLGIGDVQQAGYFSERALTIAETLGTPFELGTCLITHAAVRSAAGDHAGALGIARRAIGLFREIGADAPMRVAYYRLALCAFRSGNRQEAVEAAGQIAAMSGEPWALGILLPLVRENPMFAQWVASRGVLGQAFAELLERHTFIEQQQEATAAEEASVSRFPRVAAQSFGALRVQVNGKAVTDEEWASARSREMFYLFLANRDGIRKEDAVERLYPEIEPEKSNSAFHSNLYRIRRALYQESVVKRDGTYMLNPDGEFEWDVEEFEGALAQAQGLPAGSEQRAAEYERALQLYRGPFAESFYSEWAEAVRHRTEVRAMSAYATLAGYYAGKGSYEEAASCLEAVVERGGEVNEEIAYHLATYRARAGQAATALAFIDSYARQQEESYGEPVPGRIRELRRQIAAGIAV